MTSRNEVCEMQNAEAVLGILRERGKRGLPCNELYRQLFNPQFYLLAYGRIYSNKGAMTPGVTEETADGMSMGKIEAIIEAMRHERYRFKPARRILIPKKNGKTRPLGLPTWSVRETKFRIPVGGSTDHEGATARRCSSTEGTSPPPIRPAESGSARSRLQASALYLSLIHIS